MQEAASPQGVTLGIGLCIMTGAGLPQLYLVKITKEGNNSSPICVL